MSVATLKAALKAIFTTPPVGDPADSSAQGMAEAIVTEIENPSGSVVFTVNGRDGDVVLAKSDVGLGNVDNTSDANKPISTATQTALDGKISTTEKAAANGVATLGADGKLTPGQVPAIAIVDTFVVASEASMLALAAEQGDVAVRSDLNKSFILTTAPASTLANWQELLTPTDSVQSVDGRSGVVTLSDLYAPIAKGVTNGDSHDHNGGDGAQIDHVNLGNKGTNTHAQIDTFIDSKASANGLASLNASSKVVQDPANAQTTAASGKIPIADAGGKIDTWVSDASTTVKGKVELATDGESAAGLAVQANDGRLSNARTPTAHASTHQPGGSDAMAVDAAAATGSLRTLGTGGQQACAGNDSRLSNARTPTAHASTHASAGSDPITPANIGAQPADATLTALAGLVNSAGSVPYFTGTDAMAVAPSTSFGRGILDKNDAATARNYIGAEPAFTKNTAFNKNFGTGVNDVCQGNDSRLSAVIPTGGVTMWAGSGAAPAGFLLCDGSAVSRTTYSALFAALGTTWGAGDGSTTFNVPDMRGAAPAGVGTSSGYTQNETIALANKYDDQVQGHKHGTTGDWGGIANLTAGAGSTEFAARGGGIAQTIRSDGTNGTPRTGNVTRGKVVGLNFIIKT